MSWLKNAWRKFTEFGPQPGGLPETRVVMVPGESCFVDAYKTEVVKDFTTYGTLMRTAYFRTCAQAHAATHCEVKKVRLLKVGEVLFEVPEGWEWRERKFESKPKRAKGAK